ncbi:MAG: hypothetical protein ABI960_05870 [Candidatus Eisenbacteria bacterium]
MRRSGSAGLLSLAAALSLIVVGCQKKAEPPPAEVSTTPAPAPFKVTGIDLGKSLNADKQIAIPGVTFGPRDTIYAVIASEGAAKSTKVGARWTYQDTLVVAEDAQDLAPTGPAWTEFHLMKPTRWPKGKYAIEITVDGSPAGRKEFEIQ